MLSSALLMGSISIHVQAETDQVIGSTTTVLEDGTICTTFTGKDGYRTSTYYTENRSDLYSRFDYSDTYILNVACTDAAAFEAEFSEQYKIYQLDDGSYAVCCNDKGYANPSMAYGHGSGLTYEEADALVPSLLESSNVETVSIQYGYRIHKGGMYQTSQFIWLYSDTELTTDDFDWAVEMGYTILGLELRGNTDYMYEVEIGAPADMEYWEGIYTFMLHSVDMPTVYAVNDFMIENLIAVPLQYETIATYGNAAELTKGDINADGTTDITDAMLILQHYAETAASGIVTASETNMDVNGDGSVDLDDASAVLQIYAENAAGVNAS